MMMRDRTQSNRQASQPQVATGRGLLAVSALGLALILAAGCEESGEASTDGRDNAGTNATPPATAPSGTRLIQPNLGATAGDARVGSLGVRPSVEMDPPEVDLGFVMPNQEVSTTVMIRNTGDTPITIAAIRPSCKCTSLNNLAGYVIAPGDEVPMRASVEKRAVLSPIKANVNVIFEGYSDPVEIPIYGEVSRAVRASPSYFNCTKGVVSGRVVIESIDDRPFNILSAQGEAPDFIGFDPEIDEPISSYTLNWDVSKYTTETIPEWWVLETDHPQAPLVDIKVRHMWAIQKLLVGVKGRPWHPASQHLVLDPIPSGGAGEVVLGINTLGRDEITRAQSLSNDFDVELVSVERKGVNAECTLRIIPRAGHEGLLYGQIQLLANRGYAVIVVISTVS